VARRILTEFGADPVHGHIINGHTPVHAADGESPVKAGGLLVVIDGGFCQAYHKTTGIAGYTLISDPRGMRIKAHRPFGTIADVLDLNADIVSDDDRFEIYPSPKTIGDTDTGTQIRGQVADLRALLEAYRTGLLPERG
jgi:fructose-1,6-bisphosphatase-3